jgi:hypothetical protein
MSEIISSELFDKTLIEPLRQGANKLCIVSGYSSATMVLRHIEFAHNQVQGSRFSIDLIVGMAVQDGLENKNHKGFIELQTDKYDFDFSCSYVVGRPPVHTKLYTWLRDGNPIKAFAGSANYSQSAFSTSMREILTEVNPTDSFEYFNAIKGEVQNCSSPNISDFINLYDKRIVTEITSADEDDFISEDLESVTLTLLDASTGEVPGRSGLNWGQRPEEGREPNQAYINIPAAVQRSGFFPDHGVWFTLLTDDGKQLLCRRAQQNGKGIHTRNNSEMGEYFRYRLGLANGAFVTLADLLRYGRTDVTIYKTDEETYYMDFAVR